MTWEIIPRLFQADFAGSISAQAGCIVTCSGLSEIPSAMADSIRGWPLHILFPFWDVAALPDMGEAQTVAEVAYYEHTRGKVVVVNCNAGQNRSGLIIGLTLLKLGHTGVVETIRHAHPEALNNQTFVDELNRLEALQ